MHRTSFIVLSCLMLFFILSGGTALAHRVTVFAWVEGDTVLGEAKFSGGKKAQNSELIVYDLNGKELLRTWTNKKGEFSFPIPRKTAMRIELVAGMGHKAEWTIPLEDIDDTARVKIAQDAGTPPPEPAKNTAPEQAAHPSAFIDPVQLEAIVEKAVTKALNKKITPLTKMVANLEQKGPTINEIFGGIGYIFGLMGVAMYFSSRKKKPSND
ncbi:MAG: hypothetical protein OQK71_09890 [Desulfobacter sp.]|uniref:hypothetical protein n=1 Tax=uncultured Desulfobacter sp. TaxID=240139 RepID=UPI0029C69068|nr:hypothetical protein [uncultured Desulfobacter sp.]MCW8801224.1 hypothetical protein [Desulfobacter sp.]